jgi:alkane 1-monooxygenase
MIQTRYWPLIHLGSIGFLLTYAIPAIPMACVWAGQTTSYPNTFAFVPLFVGYVLLPAIQSIWPYHLPPIPDRVTASPQWQRYYRMLPLLSLPAQLVMLAVVADYWSSGALSVWGKLGYLLSIGSFSAFFAITLGHELIHRPHHLDRFLGGILLSTVGFGTFKVVHLRIHHRYVGTPLDFATAQRGQSIYGFWQQSFVGNFYEALRCEYSHLVKAGKRLWSSELVIWYGFSLLWFLAALGLWGWMGGIFFVSQCLIAIMMLDWTNYLQHYGLTRKRIDDSDQYEPVQLHHAWSQGLFLHDLALLNLFRHADHHTNPQRPYPLLQHSDCSPIYPYQHVVMLALSLVPHWFQRVVHPCLDRFESTLYQQGE